MKRPDSSPLLHGALVAAFLALLAAPALESWRAQQAAWDGCLLLLAWLSCRAWPFQALTDLGLLRFWFWFSLSGLGLCGGLALLLPGLGHDPQGGRLDLPLALAAALFLPSNLLLLRALRRCRKQPPGRRSASRLPTWRPWGPSAALLLFTILLLLHQGWRLPFQTTPLRGGAALSLLLLPVAALWLESGAPALRRRGWARAGWLGQLVVAGVSLAWVLDLLWLTRQGRLPQGTLSLPVLLPGVLTLALGAELLVLAAGWREWVAARRSVPNSQTLPLVCALAVGLWALALQRPGLALGAGLFAAWLDLRAPAAPARGVENP